MYARIEHKQSHQIPHFFFEDMLKNNKDIQVFTNYILLKTSNNLKRKIATLVQLYI